MSADNNLLDAGVRSFSVAVGKFEDIKCEMLYLDSFEFKGMYQKYLKNRTHQFQDQFLNRGVNPFLLNGMKHKSRILIKGFIDKRMKMVLYNKKREEANLLISLTISLLS